MTMTKWQIVNNLVQLILRSPKLAVESELMGLYHVGFYVGKVKMQFTNGGILDILPHYEEEKEFYRFRMDDIEIIVDKES